MDKPSSAETNRRPWKRPTLKPLGTIGDVLNEGKPSGGSGDTGEPKKNSQQG